MGKKAKRRRSRRKFVEVWEARNEWLEIALRTGSIRVGWDADPISPDEWNAACRVAGFNPNDWDLGFGVLVWRHKMNTALRVGDIVASDGGAVSILRRIPRRRRRRKPR